MTIKIAGIEIGRFIIVETSDNRNQSLVRALELIEAVA